MAFIGMHDCVRHRFTNRRFDIRKFGKRGIERERERLGITNEDIVEKWNEIYQKSRERYDELIEEAERE